MKGLFIAFLITLSSVLCGYATPIASGPAPLALDFVNHTKVYADGPNFSYVKRDGEIYVVIGTLYKDNVCGGNKGNYIDFCAPTSATKLSIAPGAKGFRVNGYYGSFMRNGNCHSGDWYPYGSGQCGFFHDSGDIGCVQIDRKPTGDPC